MRAGESRDLGEPAVAESAGPPRDWNMMNPSDRTYAVSLGLNLPDSFEEQRTYAIFGTRRGGTSMVAGVARALGLDLGDPGHRKNNEDPRFHPAPLPALWKLVEQRNSEADVWGWKYPAGGRYITELSGGLRNPYFIVVYRDPVAAAKSQLARDPESKRRTDRLAIHEAASSVALNTGFVLATERPVLLVSNERAMTDQEGLIDDVAAFVGSSIPTAPLRGQILDYIKPGRYKSFDNFFAKGEIDT
jgi:hypothetical protein